MTTDHGKETTARFAVVLTELLVILIINTLTIVVFARIRHLRKRSTYLIINLTVADLLVGALTIPLSEFQKEEEEFTWPGFMKFTTIRTFQLAFQINLSLISLERLHATLFPFRHCLIGKSIYYKTIIGSWFVTLLIASLMAYLQFNAFDTLSYLWASFNLLTLLVIAISYIIIIANIRRSHRGLTFTERKLTVTLFIVTGVSVLTILPCSLYHSIPFDMQNKWPSVSGIPIHNVTVVIYYASSIVNPIVYAIRLKEFRKAIGKLATRQSGAEYPQTGAGRSRVHGNQPVNSVPI